MGLHCRLGTHLYPGHMYLLYTIFFTDTAAFLYSIAQIVDTEEYSDQTFQQVVSTKSDLQSVMDLRTSILITR